MDKEFVKAFRDVIREEVMKKNRVEIDGLGQFELIHEKQVQKKMDDGQVLMMPPRDVLRFSPQPEGEK